MGSRSGSHARPGVRLADRGGVGAAAAEEPRNLRAKIERPCGGGLELTSALGRLRRRCPTEDASYSPQARSNAITSAIS